MIFPLLSVSLIGTIVGAFMHGQGHRQALVRGVVGAWIGFAVGAIPGVIVDVAAQTGAWVAIIGHIGAVAGAVVIFQIRQRKTPTPSLTTDDA